MKETETFKRFKEFWNKQKKNKEFTIAKISLELRTNPQVIRNYLIDIEKGGKAEIKRDIIRNRIVGIVKKGNLK